MTDHILIQSLKFSYNKQQAILNIPELSIPLHQLSLLHGRSGSGKSTLLKIIAGLLPKYGGQLTGNVSIPHQQSVAMMFQDPGMQFALDTPRHEIEFALENLQTPAKTIPSIVDQTLHDVGITHLADRHFTTLSGGEQQRATLAVIIAMQRQIILLDEPFASLDYHNRDLILQKLVALVREGKTVIIADHDLSAYTELSPNIIEFGQTVHCLTNQETQALLETATHQPSLTTPIPEPDQPNAVILENYILQRNATTLINQTALQIVKNKTTLLTGESGSGKSSFFKSLINLVPSAGTIKLCQQSAEQRHRQQRGKSIGLVFQNANDQFLKVTVQEELELSLKNGRNPFFTNHRLQLVLNHLGLNHLTNQVVYTLSGGQKKKLQLLVMLMMGQPLLLLDEPFSGLDYHSITNVVDLMQRSLAVYPQTLVIISHQIAALTPLIDYHLHLAHHRLQYQEGTTK
ncbi:ATP-binding cassette domain-containing protein [uncultured Limosilactobacillus sp.]|uniref:ATP-binding cassette domain-containing protein n=1 Tax=uncultured Limosilactobacillus sp. TaxID=2837629 RepID=UPI0025DC2517|nr:ABC transporter ATP-binding protein [uncultured Limosilactobacillus sp.]